MNISFGCTHVHHDSNIVMLTEVSCSRDVRRHIDNSLGYS